ncbi:MAG: hypothetical protein M1823_002166 [Watsoniomyces obsoletus]|nr:MAG: hypothetical protein M1823_002166 [Watsoniomyces obsoletus]
MATGRNASIQPVYDFLTGSASPPPAPSQQQRSTFRQSQLVKPDQGNQDLRAELKALQYELSTFKQERDLLVLRHEKELSEVQAKADSDFNKAQILEAERNAATRRYESLAREIRDSQDAAINERADLERQLRTAREKVQAAEDNAEELRTELESHERQSTQRIQELQRRNDSLQDTSSELRRELEVKHESLQTTQQTLAAKEAQQADLENEVLRLKAHAGDTETMEVIKQEISEQVSHIKKLEVTNREQLSELKRYRKYQRGIEIVEEEKRGLESKLARMDDLRKELSESQLQKQILEDERKAWSMYFQTEGGNGNGKNVEYDSPEAMARALVEERLQKAALLEKVGGLQAEMVERDEMIRGLEGEIQRLKTDVEKLKTSGGGRGNGVGGASRSRLERQKALAVKEVEFLRAQLRTFDAEDATFNLGKLDELKAVRIQELEELVDEHRKEIAVLHDQLLQKEDGGNNDISKGPHKRLLDDTKPHLEDERIGVLTRKNRALQDEISKLTQTITLLHQELSIQKSQITSLKQTSRTRILELRKNPTSDHTAIKQSTLDLLREENRELLSLLEQQSAHTESNPHGKNGEREGNERLIPLATLNRTRLEIHDLERLVAEKEKRMTRLKQIWSSKSLEFREAVASILGWKMDFLPNGRVRLSSLTTTNNNPMKKPREEQEVGGKDEEEDDERSIIFDGEQGTMKISGGGEMGVFGREIQGLIRFWVEERKSVPCLMAALVLEEYEKRST